MGSFCPPSLFHDFRIATRHFPPDLDCTVLYNRCLTFKVSWPYACSCLSCQRTAPGSHGRRCPAAPPVRPQSPPATQEADPRLAATKIKGKNLPNFKPTNPSSYITNSGEQQEINQLTIKETTLPWIFSAALSLRPHLSLDEACRGAQRGSGHFGLNAPEADPHSPAP